jgi:hypothetical protein
MQISESAFKVIGTDSKRNRRLKKIPEKAAADIANLRSRRKKALLLTDCTFGTVKRRANGPEKRTMKIIMETTRARDSMALLSSAVNWPD